MFLARLAPTVLLVLTACGQASPPAAQPSATATVAAGAAADTTEAMRDYAAVNDRMHAAMGEIDRDPDVAFVRGMIPHHRGAVEMAEVVLKHGKDPATHDLARRVIAAQREEIAEMEAWLAKRGQPTTALVPAAGAGHQGH